uniref:hypothetical protein n=1 Tax=Oculatella sp. LEGE 06141 TaxID=1828648 RepID=UPI00187EEC6D
SSPPTPAPTEAVLPTADSLLPLRSPNDIDLNRFNTLVGDWPGEPLKDMKHLFVKKVILDDQTTIDVETVKVPGFIGIADPLELKDVQDETVSGHEDIAKFLARDGLLICTYQWHKERHGVAMDLRQPLSADLFTEAFIKNEGHHSGAVVPALLKTETGSIVNGFATFNEPDGYHNGLYGSNGYVAAAQKLVFPNFVTKRQARGYTDSIICWMAMMNPFAQFPPDYNGGDPTYISDRHRLHEFLKNVLLAGLGDRQALSYFNDPLHKTYCAEFMFVGLNTPVYPFTRKGLTTLLGNERQAEQILALRDQQNNRQPNTLSRKSGNPQFKAFNIPMPVVPDDLPPLDQLMAQHGQTIDPNSLPFPPFKISQVIRRAFHTLLPRQQFNNDPKLVEAQARLFSFMEPALLQQLGLESLPANDPKVVGVREFIKLVSHQLAQPFDSPEAFDAMVDGLMAKADEMLVGEGDRVNFVPPRIYVDLGQQDGDDNLPQGWGFHLETVAALIAREVIKPGEPDTRRFS